MSSSAISRFIELTEMIFGGLFLLLAVILVSIEVGVRAFLGLSIVGVEQISSFLIMWSVFFAASHAIFNNRHIRVDILCTLLPSFLRWVVEIISTSCMLIFTGFLTYSGFLLVQENYQLGEETIGLVTIPFWVPQMVMMFGGALMTFRLVERLKMLLLDKNLAEGVNNPHSSL